MLQNQIKEREVKEMKKDFLRRNKRNNANRPSRYHRGLDNTSNNKY